MDISRGIKERIGDTTRGIITCVSEFCDENLNPTDKPLSGECQDCETVLLIIIHIFELLHLGDRFSLKAARPSEILTPVSKFTHLSGRIMKLSTPFETSIYEKLEFRNIEVGDTFKGHQHPCSANNHGIWAVRTNLSCPFESGRNQFFGRYNSIYYPPLVHFLR